MVIARTPVELAQIRKLLHSIRTSNYDQIQRLYEKGIHGLINFNDPITGETPLLIAIEKNDEKMAEYLLRLGADPDGTDFQGRTPLIRAAEFGFVEGVHLLINANADPNLRDLRGNNTLFASLSDGTYRQQQCFYRILSHSKTNVGEISENGKSLLISACEKGLPLEKICLALIERGVNIHAIDQETGQTALHVACASGLVKVVRELVERGADPNARDHQQQTPTHKAVTSNIFELLPILSAYNAQFDLVDQKLNTPIHLAAMFNRGQMIKYLVQRGGTTKMKNIDRLTPMKIAAERKNKDAKKAIRFADKKGFHRPIVSPKSNPHRDYQIHLYDWLQERFERLLRRFHQVEDSTTHRIQTKDLKEILRDEGFIQITNEDLNDLILRHETNPNEIDYQTFLSGKLFIPKSFLLSSFVQTQKKKKKKKKKSKKQIYIPIAVQDEGPRMANGQPAMCFVRKHQFITDPNRFSRDHLPKNFLDDDSIYYLDKVSPEYIHIHNAAHRGDLHTMLNAFQSGVPVDIRDKFFKTPLMIAAATGDLETVEFLLQCGANVHLEDHFKWTPLHHAANAGHINVVRALVDAGAKISHESLTSATPLSRAIESSALDVVQYLLNKRANVRHENLTQRNLLDLAADFASPDVFNLIRSAYEQKSKQKNKTTKKRRSTSTKKKKTKDSELPAIPLKPVKFDVPLPRRGSLLRAEQKLITSNQISESIVYHPLTKWTNQPTTKELLEKKIKLRDAFTMKIDFLDYKRPLLANASDKLEFERRKS